MKKTLIILMCFCIVKILPAQNTGIGTNTPVAKLDIVAALPSSPTNQDGILIPRINSFPVLAPTSTQNG
ncbi:MAG: hypothetical protein ACOYLO_07155, partial [Ferruginibacter sp.]